MAQSKKAQLSPKQIGLIHVAKAKLGLGDDEYRDLLESATGVRSSTDIPPRSFSYLMERFAELGFVSDMAARSYGHRESMATPAQVNLISGLWRDCHNGEMDQRHLGNWLYRQFRVSALRFVNFETARKIIKALQDWKRRYPSDSQGPSQ